MGSGRMPRVSRGANVLRGCRRSGWLGDFDVELGPGTRLGVGPDAATVGSDDAPTGVEADAGTFALKEFGCLDAGEFSEEAVALVGWDAGAFVPDSEV